MHAIHAVDTQSWGELVEAARTVVMTVVICWVGMFSTSTWVHMARPLPGCPGDDMGDEDPLGR